MRLLTLAAAVVGPLSAHAFVAFTNSNFTGITAGQPFELTWQGDGTPVAITLESGPIGNLQPVQTITTSAIGSSYSWTSPSNTSPGLYALQISQGGYTNYSPQFTIAASASPTTPPPTSAPAENFASNPTTPYSYTALPASAPYAANPTGLPEEAGTPTDFPSENIGETEPEGTGTASLIEQPPYPYASGNGTPTYVIASASGGILYPSGTGYNGNGTLIFAGGARRVAGSALGALLGMAMALMLGL